MDAQLLFLTIQNSIDWQTDDKGKDLQFKIMVSDEEKRIYILVQETKSKKDWLHNFLFLPFPFRLSKGNWIIVHAGWLYLSSILSDCLKKELFGFKFYEPVKNGYDIVFAAWSAGVAIAELTATRLVKEKLIAQPQFVGYASPAYCYGQKSADKIRGQFAIYYNFLWFKDWIKYLVPFCARNTSGEVLANGAPCKTLDERHRIYGKGLLIPKNV